jgi:hypothetical protein
MLNILVRRIQQLRFEAGNHLKECFEHSMFPMFPGETLSATIT